MAESPPYPDSYGDTGLEPGGGPTTGAPRWVKVFGIIALLVVVLVAILLLVGGGPGNHGPGRHTGGQTSPSSVTGSGGAGGHTPPAGGHTP